MAFLLIMVAAAAVIVIVSTPFRREPTAAPAAATADENRARQRQADLEVAREVKYREIRDAELDHRTGKLSDEDFHLIDGALRAEAITILQELDRMNAAEGDTISA